jgi:ubiquinone/menaquinone biosynthesis C-methylase UbiE
MLNEAFDSLWALSSLRVAVETGIIASLVAGPRNAKDLAKVSRLDATLVTRIADVLVAYGFLTTSGDDYALSESGRMQAARGDALRADIAVTFGNARALADEARRGTLVTGWRPFDSEVIRSQAQLSLEMSLAIARPVKKAWPDVAQLLERDGAVHLDIGVGGAGGAIGMAKAFPNLRIVGVDPLPAALVEARANVAAHDMQDRIELRPQRGDELTEVNHFATAFLPSTFFDDAALQATLHTLAKALKSDGAVITFAWRDVGEPRAAATSKLRCEMWGAGPRTTDEVTAMLNAASFRNVRIGPSQGAMVPIIAKLA